MPCSSCGKKRSSSKVIPVERSITVDGYKEGDDGYVTIVYTGDVVRRVRGKCTNHMYLFGIGATRLMDKCDAEEIVKLSDFDLVIEKKKTSKVVEKVDDGDSVTADSGKEDTDA